MGHRWVNVFYVQITHTNPITVNDLKALADYIGANWWPLGSSHVSSSCVLTQVDVSFIPSTGNVLDYVGTYSLAGTGSTAVADAGACIVVDWIISSRYRGGHPRNYLPGVLASDVTNGSQLSSALQTSMATGLGSLRNGINALTSTNITAAQMGTVHFQSGGNWKSPPTFDAYTSLKVGNNGLLGSQRRRIHS